MIEARALDLNILPERYRPRRLRLRSVLAVLVVIALLLGLVPVYDTLTEAQARSAYLESRLTQAKATLSQAQAEQVRLQEQVGELEAQIDQVRTETRRIATELATLGRQRTTRAEGIAAAITALVPRVRIVRIWQEGETYTLEGKAGSQALVLDYARMLQASGQYANVRIVSLVNTDPLGIAPDVEFSIVMER